MTTTFIGNTLLVEAGWDINNIEAYRVLVEENGEIENLILKVATNVDLVPLLTHPEIELSALLPRVKKIIIKNSPGPSKPTVKLDSLFPFLSKACSVEELILENLVFTSDSDEACQASLAALGSIQNHSIKVCQIRCSVGVVEMVAGGFGGLFGLGERRFSSHPLTNSFPSVLMDACPLMEELDVQYHPASYPLAFGRMDKNWGSMLGRPVSCILRTLSIDVGDDCTGFCNALMSSFPPSVRELEIAFTYKAGKEEEEMTAIAKFLANEGTATQLVQFTIVLKSARRLLGDGPPRDYIMTRLIKDERRPQMFANLALALKDGSKPLMKTFRLRKQQDVQLFVQDDEDVIVSAMVQAIHANPQLTTVEFPWGAFDTGGGSVSMHLRVNQQLEHLQTVGNNVHDWMIALAKHSNNPEYLFYLLIKNPGLFDLFSA